jgi:hypothetical protein
VGGEQRLPIFRVFDVNGDQVSRHGSVTFVEVSSTTKQGSGCIVDAPMLSKVLIPGHREEDL